jgi:chorismate synthase
VCRVAFKPTATIASEQKTVTTAGEATTLAATGRHDPCVLPRAVPIVEAMTLLVLADHWLRQAATSVLDRPALDRSSLDGPALDRPER